MSLLPRRALVLATFTAAAVGMRVDAQTMRPDSFALGATREEVRSIQGRPTVIETLTSLGVEIWTWRTASARFALADGRLIGWTDGSRELRARLDAAARTAADSVSLGTSAAALLQSAGRPIAVARKDGRDLWWYGHSVVAIDAPSRRVIGWREADRRLPVRAAERAAAERAITGGAGAEAAGLRTGAPPSLTLRVSLRDTSSAARTSGARNALVVTVTNEGPGTAYGVLPVLRTEGTRRTELPLRPGAVTAIASLTPGGRATREIAFELPEVSEDSVVQIGVAVSELYGFDADRGVVLAVPVLSARRPSLVLEELRVDDQSGDGRLSPREIADVTVRLRNDGAVAARDLSATLSLGRDVFAAAGTPPRFELGTLDAGASVAVTFAVYTNTRADSLAVALDVRAARSARPTRLPIVLPLERAVVSGPATSRDDARASRGGDGADSLAPPWRATANPNAVAVVIGIDRYRRVPPARYAARDAGAVRRWAVDAFGVPDDAEHLYVRLDADATGGELRKAFGETGWLSRRTGPQTDVLVYFAGHGAASADGRPLVLPWDADPNYPRETAIALADVYDALAKLPARTITVVLDACFSGVSRGNVSLSEGGRPIVVSIEHPALLRRGMAVFAAARGAEVAADLPDARHGVFTYTFLRALRGDGDADGDGAVTVDELDRYLSREVPRRAAARDREQHPLVIARDPARVVLRRP